MRLHAMELFRSSQAPTPTMQNPSVANCQNKKYAFHPVSALTLFTPAYPVSATPTHMLRICVHSPLEKAYKKYFVCN